MTTDQQLRDAVVETKTHVAHISATVDKLASVIDAHVSRTSDTVRDLHAKIDVERKDADKKYMSKEMHSSLRRVVYAIGSVATLAVTSLAGWIWSLKP